MADDVQTRLMPLEVEPEDTPMSLWKRRGITLLTVDPYITEGPEPPQKHEVAPAPRYTTREFWVYFVALATVPAYMIYVPIRLSYPSTNANFSAYENRLVPGWMNGRRRDNSDYQYRLFRDYLPMLCALIGAYSVLSWCVKGLVLASRCTAAQQLHIRKLFWGTMGAVCVGALHGTNTLKLLALALINYYVAHAATRLTPTASRTVVWVWNAAALFLVFYLDGVPYARLTPALAWLVRVHADTGHVCWTPPALVHQLQFLHAALRVVRTRLPVGGGQDTGRPCARACARRAGCAHPHAPPPPDGRVRPGELPALHILPAAIYCRPNNDL